MVNVAYIVGKGRSGSTLLADLLGQVDGFVSVGELWHLWDLQDRLLRCGCGRTLRDCPQWSSVLSRLEQRGIDLARGRDLQRVILRWKALPRLALQMSTRPPRWSALREYVDLMQLVYAAIEETTGAKVIVDSSKWPFDPGVIGLMPNVNAVAVHLIRDPRAVAYSWQRRKRLPDSETELMPQYSAAFSALSWLSRNAVVELLRFRPSSAPSLLLKYEDLIADPEDSLSLIAERFGVELPVRLDVGGGSIRFRPTHTVAGNPDRLNRGNVTLRLDTEWTEKMRAFDRRLVTALTLPLIARYKYPVRIGRART